MFSLKNPFQFSIFNFQSQIFLFFWLDVHNVHLFSDIHTIW